MDRKKLENWKQIAYFLGCSERTAKRYQAKGLPVHYLGGHQLQRVYAYEEELTFWIESGRKVQEFNPFKEMPETVSSAEDSCSSLRMVCISGKSIGEIFLLCLPVVRIGREADNHIVVSENDVSRYHARLILQEKEISIEDLQSKNGTFINNHRIDKILSLHDGDRIRLGMKLEFLLKNVNNLETY